MPTLPRLRLPPEVSPIRSHNEGTIFYRKREKRWCAAVSIPGGRRREKQAEWFDNSRDRAKELLRVLIEERDAELVPARKLTLASYLRSWIADMDARPATIVSYKGVVENHIIPALGTIPLGKLGPTAIQRWLDSMSGPSVPHRRAVLRNALNAAVEDRYIVRNPIIGTHIPSVPKHRSTVLTAEQAGQLIEGTRDDWYGPLWAVLLASGLRISEALALTWDGFDGTSITVRYQLARRNGEWVRVPTKAARSVEKVALPAFASEALTRLKGGQDFGHCFLTPAGDPPSEQQCLQALYAAEKRLGLPKVTLHELRHSSLTLLADAGVPEDVRQRRAGHSTTAMARRYVHGAEAADRVAADTLQDAIGGKG